MLVVPYAVSTNPPSPPPRAVTMCTLFQASVGLGEQKKAETHRDNHQWAFLYWLQGTTGALWTSNGDAAEGLGQADLLQAETEGFLLWVIIGRY